ncbi:DMT family transporter [Bariatricus sp. SGI.154]|uniref:DMT family transporter n=1 Tax=Bariatricus sp. SGI.154 TaxID=3420549 RepID=UPI003D070356
MINICYGLFKISLLFDGLLIGIWQLGFVSIYAWIASFIFKSSLLPKTTAQWWATLGLALFCSAFGFVMQPVAQRHTTPEHTGLMMSLEPVFSAIFSFFFLGEHLSLKGYIGAFLILCGIFITIATFSCCQFFPVFYTVKQVCCIYERIIIKKY